MQTEDQQKEPYDQDHILADVADFWVNDLALHQLIGHSQEMHHEALEIRDRIFRVIEKPDGKKNDNLINRALGEVHKIDTKSPIRIKFLDFLEKLAKTKIEKKTVKRQASHPLTQGERIAKGKAKIFYDNGNYETALKIGLSILQGGKAKNNPGVIGFIMNCYNKLNNYEKALEYAEILMELEKEEVGLACYAIAGMAALKIRNFKKSLYYYEKALEIKKDDPGILNMIYIVAINLKEYSKCLKYAQALLEIEPNNLNALITVMNTSDTLGYKGIACRAAKDVLAKRPENKQALTILKKYKKSR